MKYVVGIDEVGRGPLAGPVTVCAVMCELVTYRKLQKLPTLPVSGKDSKKLDATKRKLYGKELTRLSQDRKIHFSIVHVSNKIIDAKGISHAIRSAIHKNLSQLRVDSTAAVLLDGGLKAPLSFKNQTTIIKGDEKEKIIAWASILAKVSRDAIMARASSRYPQYGFELHKGYGTRKHQESIKNHGLSPLHRKTFCKRWG